MNCYRIIDPEAKGPISAIEVTGPPTSHLARQIAARALQGCSPNPTDEEIHQALTDRLVVRRMGDRFLRWVVNELHACFEAADGQDYDGNQLQIEEYNSDGLTLAFHPLHRSTGKASPFPRRRVLVLARLI